MKKIAKHAMLACASGIFLVISGCATGPQANPRDPLEPLNRTVFGFNEVVDNAVLKPVATVYTKVTPALVRTGVTNFFSNLTEVWSTANNALQFKGREAVESWMRFSINTVFGLGGIFDLATDMGLERHKEDFGQTLGSWGVPSGPYLVLPLLGSSTVRDTAALPLDMQGNALNAVPHSGDRDRLTGLNLVNTRANLLRASAVLDDAALDKYTFSRDFYLQARRSEVYDGNPPEPAAEPAK
ncbi:phospholipid-binding lipoprotein MlaA [Rhodoferax ferrireducens]|uniref:Phospholipid-binding lipoprotein MlaA n=1 Tax=Rhodoferax ferrireducens TaxID=192843 RepID=A0ABU2CFL4_9BURK|nr:VacJ family lipoprotein [Rhodoferax ferrireducens]MDR7380135.1 phospholipid-binding lipoprotein MlaA [Rhodoferax ferrireducens]